VWDSDSGELLLRLVGHANQVTCLLLLDRDTLVTGGSDKTLRLWSLIDGKCSKVVEQAHNGSVKVNNSRAPYIKFLHRVDACRHRVKKNRYLLFLQQVINDVVLSASRASTRISFVPAAMTVICVCGTMTALLSGPLNDKKKKVSSIVVYI
jgi:hypothetical protein